MAEEQRRSGIGGIGDGIRTGIGILSAFKEAIEETLADAVQRGDLSPDRAGQAMRNVADRVQESLDDALDRFDFVSRKEHDDLKAEVAQLRERLARLEGERPRLEAPGSPGIIITE